MRTRLLVIVAFLVCHGASTRSALGQEVATSRLHGKVETRSESPLPEVEVTILSLSRTALTDSAGRFDFSSVPPGDYVVRVRRIGFRAQQFSARLEAQGTKEVLIVMEAGAHELPDIEVTSRSLKPIEYAYTHKYDDFFRYRYLGWGLFKTRSQFESLNPLRVADIVRGMSRVRVRDFMWENPEVGIYGCKRLGIYIDGSLQYPVTNVSGDRLDRIHPSHVEMIAVFRGSAEMPAEAAMFVHNDCAIMIWTR